MSEYDVAVRREGSGWDAEIVDPSGRAVLRRSCGSRGEAEVFASSVRQHLAWLSPERFRAYYRIDETP